LGIEDDYKEGTKPIVMLDVFDLLITLEAPRNTREHRVMILLLV
jgi:hypothetical protein